MRCMTEEVVGEKSWWQLSMGIEVSGEVGEVKYGESKGLER